MRLRQTQTDLAPGHVSLINVYEAILTPQHLGLVMEWAAGGCLTTRVADRFPQTSAGSLVMEEDEARFYFTQFIDAVDYCHKHNIAHRYEVLGCLSRVLMDALPGCEPDCSRIFQDKVSILLYCRRDLAFVPCC